MILPSCTSMFTQIRHILFSYADINTLVAAFICKSRGQKCHWHMYIFTFTPLECDGGVEMKKQCLAPPTGGWLWSLAGRDELA